MKVHKFICENGHEFYLSINLPLELEKFVEYLNKLTCPLCKSEKININPNVKEIV